MNYYNYMYIHCAAHYGLILVIDYKSLEEIGLGNGK